MSTAEPAGKRNVVIFALVTVVVLAAVGFGTGYAWRALRGPTPATAADCALAQELFDRAGNVPADKVAAEAFERELREVRYTRFDDQGISTEVGRYISWQVSKVTGNGNLPDKAKFDEMAENAQGHCGEHRELNIPAFDF